MPTSAENSDNDDMAPWSWAFWNHVQIDNAEQAHEEGACIQKLNPVVGAFSFKLVKGQCWHQGR
jgi:hypothetical protein